MMTSKEALEYITSQLEGQYYDDCTCLEDDDLKAINAIQEDLNRLEELEHKLQCRNHEIRVLKKS